MPDVLELAIRRREKLRAEINQLNAFINVGEQLMRDMGESVPASEPEVKSIHPTVVRSAALGA